MYIPKEMKLNRFVDANIPENKHFFARYGFNNVGSELYTGDQEFHQTQNKTDELAIMEAYDKRMQAEESNE